MKIFMAGASGTVGRRIIADRLARGDHIVAMSRRRERLAAVAAQPGARGRLEVVEGDPGTPGQWQRAIDGCDVVINLAGAGILDRRWSNSYQALVRQSRVDSSYQIARGIEQAGARPKLLMNASAVGFYGPRDDRALTERDDLGKGFLAEVCGEWEAQAQRAAHLLRVVCLRFGVVLDREGGALRKMLPVFRWGLGGRLANGRQYMSWIAWQDLVASVNFLIEREDLSGPVNIVSPEPITNRVFTRALAKTLRRPACFPVPSLAMKLLVGRGAGVVLDSQRVVPEVLSTAGFQWQFPTISRALAAVLRPSESTTAATPTLAVIDIDEFSPGDPLLRRVLRDLGTRVTNVALVTSMGPEGAREFLKQSDLDCEVIVVDGAAVVTRDPSVVRDQTEIPIDIQTEVLRCLAGSQGDLEVTLEDNRGERRSGDKTRFPDPIADCLRIRVTGSVECLQSVIDAVGPDLWKAGKIQVHRDRPGRLEIVAGRVDRSIAVQRLAKRWSIAPENVGSALMVFRSRGLAQWSSRSVALHGADEGVRDSCGQTTTHGGVEGLAEAIDALFG